MSSNHLLLKKEELELDLKKSGKEILRELFFCSHHLTLYGREHPAKDKATKKPFGLLRRFFRLRSYFDIHLYQGELCTMGIPQDKEVFIRSLKSELSRFSLGSVFIYSQVGPEELAIFLRRLREKSLHSHRNLNLQMFLEEKKITSIRVKKSEPEDPFVEESRAMIEKGDDLRVGTLAKLSLQQEPEVMLDILLKKLDKDIDLEGRVKFDFRLRVFQSVVLGEFYKLSADKVVELMLKEFGGGKREMILTDKKYQEGMRSLIEALRCHPHGEYLSNQLKELLASLAIPEDLFKETSEDNTPESQIHKPVYG
jgi:hypothetical protein